MQAMARQQAASGAVARGGEDGNPFATLSVWRDKLQADLSALGVGGPDFKLRLLLEQGKDVEQAVLGCLKDALWDLHEGVVWGLLEPAFEQGQQKQLLNAAANELNTDKQLVLQLAREHGLLEEYAAQVQKPAHHTLVDYDRVAELRFAMLVWRANLKRDASLIGRGGGSSGGDPLAMELLFRGAYTEALRLIRRCGSKSLAYWAGQQAGHGPSEASKLRLHQAAVERVQNVLLELAQSFNVSHEALQGTFKELADPEAVAEEAEEAEPANSGAAGPSRGSRKDAAASTL